jgi:hypothetical protein
MLGDGRHERPAGDGSSSRSSPPATARKNLAASGILDLIRQQFAAGTVSDLNVAQQEALVEQVQATIRPLERPFHPPSPFAMPATLRPSARRFARGTRTP